MAGRFSATTVVDRPIEQLFDFLADGTNDRLFSRRVVEIEKATDGPIGVGTVWASTVKDGGMTTKRRFEITEFERPTRMRWTERSPNALMVPEGGYDLRSIDATKTELTLFNVLEGRTLFGRLIEGFALRQARKSVGQMVGAIRDAAQRGPEAPGAP